MTWHMACLDSGTCNPQGPYSASWPGSSSRCSRLSPAAVRSRASRAILAKAIAPAAAWPAMRVLRPSAASSTMAGSLIATSAARCGTTASCGPTTAGSQPARPLATAPGCLAPAIAPKACSVSAAGVLLRCAGQLRVSQASRGRVQGKRTDRMRVGPEGSVVSSTVRLPPPAAGS